MGHWETNLHIGKSAVAADICNKIKYQDVLVTFTYKYLNKPACSRGVCWIDMFVLSEAFWEYAFIYGPLGENETQKTF